MAHKTEGDPITVADIEKEIEQSGATLEPGTIALIRTDRDRYLGRREYWKRGTGMSAASFRSGWWGRQLRRPGLWPFWIK